MSYSESSCSLSFIALESSYSRIIITKGAFVGGCSKVFIGGFCMQMNMLRLMPRAPYKDFKLIQVDASPPFCEILSLTNEIIQTC